MGLFKTIFGSGPKSAYDTSGIANATTQANELLKSQYNTNTANLAPFLQYGTSGVNRLSDLLGLSGNTTAQGYGTLGTIDPNAYMNDAGYQFRLAEGNKAIERAASAGGALYSPATTKALMQYGQGLASEEYGNAFNRALQSNQTLYNMLSGATGTGFDAVGTQSDFGNVYAGGTNSNNLALQNAILASNQAKNAARTSAWQSLLGAGTQLGAAAFGARGIA